MLSLSELLDLEKIKAWAEAKEPGSAVGLACRTGDCPVAWYLKEQTGKNPFVGTNNILLFEQEEEGRSHMLSDTKRTPPDIRRIIKLVDAEGSYRFVKREELLGILATVAGS